MKRDWFNSAVAIAAIVGLVLVVLLGGRGPAGTTGQGSFGAQSLGGGMSSFSGVNVAAPTSATTATPAVLINNQGLGSALEIQDAGTPVFYVDTAGNTTISGTCSGCSINSGSGLRITQPTAAATATPALAVNSLAAGAKLLEVSDAATPVFNILNGGAWSSTGAGTHSGGQTINNWVKSAAPTAIATATPAFVVDSLGVSNIFEVRDAATPVFTINNGGNAVLASGNYPIEHGSAGREIYFAVTSAFTGTTTVLSTTTNIAAVTVVLCSVDDPDDDAGDAFICIGSASDGDITLTALDTAGDTSTEADTTVYYAVFGN